MRIDAIPVGRNPPHDVNVFIEVPIGGEPIKYEMDKDAGHAGGRPLPLHLDALSRGTTASSRIRSPATATRATC